MYKTIVGPDGKVIEVSDINYPVVKSGIYTTEEVIDMLKKLKAEIEEKSYYDTHIIGDYEDEVRVYLVELDDVNKIIQQKINALKEGQA